MDYAFRFSGPVTALRAGARAGARAKSKIDYPLRPLNSLLSINCWQLPGGSKANMSLNHLPPELLGLILANIFPDEWNHYDSGFEILNVRIVCRKYSKRVF
jgi:hypothetical protein